MVDQRRPSGELGLAPAGGRLAPAGARVHELLLHEGWWVGGGRRVRPRAGPGSRRRTGPVGRVLGRPAPAAEGDDGFAVVAAGGAVGAGLGAAVQGDAAGHAGHGPGAVAHVDQPGGTSGHDRLLPDERGGWG